MNKVAKEIIDILKKNELSIGIEKIGRETRIFLLDMKNDEMLYLDEVKIDE